MRFTIRPATIDDSQAINALFVETIHTINAKDYTQEQLNLMAPKDRPYTRWNERLKDHIVFVAERDGNVIGFGDITKDGYLDHLYTHKDFQGQGIASAILKKLEEAARNLGIKELRTEASITARPFFESKGFQVLNQNEKLYKGLIFINYIMSKTLTL